MIFHSFFVNVYQRVNHIQCWDHFTCGCQAVFKAHFSDIGSMIPAESLGELHFFSSNFGSPWAILRFWPTASRQIRSAPSSRPAGGYLCGLSSRRSGAYLGSESASHWTRWTFSLSPSFFGIPDCIWHLVLITQWRPTHPWPCNVNAAYLSPVLRSDFLPQ